MRAIYRRGVSILDKLIERYESKGTCWEWKAGKDRNGYGRIWHDHKNQTAHTVAYSVFVGEIPEGLHVRHSCDNPACINPEHLILGTHAENMKDKTTRKRIHGCKNPAAKFSDEKRELARTLRGRVKDVAALLGMSTCYVCVLRKQRNAQI